MTKSCIIIAVLVGVVIPIDLNGQNLNSTVSGKVVDSNNESVSFALIQIFDSSDSVFIKGEVADENGHFNIEHNFPEKIDLLITAVGISPFRMTDIETNNNVDLGIIQASISSKFLKAITVKGDRPFIERKLDKLVVNIEGSPLEANFSVLEILPSLPSLEVSLDGIVSIKGKGKGIQLQIDGKGTITEQEQIKQTLSNLSPENIEKIEIIRNPSAKYDADRGGVINIITKKDRAKSTIYTGRSQPLYPISGISGFSYGKYRAGTNLTIRVSEKIGISSNISINSGPSFRRTEEFRTDFSTNTLRQQSEFSEFEIGNWTYYSTLNFNITENVNLDITHNGVHFFNNYNRPLYIYRFSDSSSGDAEIDSLITSRGNRLDYTRLSNNVLTTQLKTKFGESGNLTLYHEYLYRPTSRIQDWENNIEFPLTSESQSLPGFYSLRDYNINHHRFGFDYSRTGENISLEAGPRMSIYSSNDDVTNGLSESEDLVFTQFNYDEIIASGYASLSFESEKIDGKVGVRGEYTSSEGSAPGLESIERKYFNLFPSATLDLSLGESNLTFSYDQRIYRPSAQDFNPNSRWSTAFNRLSGNALLEPQLTNSFELSFLLLGVNSSLSYSRTTQLSASSPAAGQILEITDSITSRGTQSDLTLYMYYSFSISERWKMFLNWDTEYTHSSLLEESNNSGNIIAFSANTTQDFDFKKYGKLQFSMSYSSPFKNYFTRVKSLFLMGLSYNVNLVKNKVRMGLSIQDMLGTWSSSGAKDTYDTQVVIREFPSNARSISLNFSYSFNSGKLFNTRGVNIESYGEKRN